MATEKLIWVIGWRDVKTGETGQQEERYTLRDAEFRCYELNAGCFGTTRYYAKFILDKDEDKDEDKN